MRGWIQACVTTDSGSALQGSQAQRAEDIRFSDKRLNNGKVRQPRIHVPNSISLHLFAAKCI